MVTVEIISIGNELLIGDVLDTNTNWLCKKITGLGGLVRRVQTVRDDPQAIGRALHRALEEKAGLVITVGGLGPTGDDLTAAAVASALGVPVELNETALAMIRARYEQLARLRFIDDPTLNEARRKMAHLPRGATPLTNPVGGAPGILLRVGNATVVCLPGVPAEMMGIFEESLPPVLKEIFGEGLAVERAIVVGCQDESVMAAALQEVVQRHPEVYIKSRAKRFGPGVRVTVTFSAAGENRAEVQARAEAALADVTAAVQALGLSVSRVET